MNWTSCSYAYSCGWLEDGRCGLGEDISTQMMHSNMPRPVRISIMSAASPICCAAGQQHSLFLLASGAILACGNILSSKENKTLEGAMCLPIVSQKHNLISDRLVDHSPQKSFKFEPHEVLMSRDAVVDAIAAGDGTSLPWLSLRDRQCLSYSNLPQGTWDHL